MLQNMKSFRGIFPHNKIPNLGRKTQSLIINYDKAGNPGTHWVCVYIDPNRPYSEVFDSYGLPPSQIIQDKLKKIGKPILYNTGQIQSTLYLTYFKK